MAIQFPGADYFEKLAIEKIVAKNRRRAKERLPNRFIHYPDWYAEFGRWIKNCRSPQCYEAYMRGEFDEDAERYFHEGRSPVYAYFKLAKPYDWERGGLQPNNGLKAKERLPNRFIHYPDWHAEFGRWLKDYRSPQCYEAYMRGDFDSVCEKWFHEGRSPAYAYFHSTIAWDRTHGGHPF